MKLIQCIVRPNKVEDVIEALRQLNVSEWTVSEVRGHGKQKGHTATSYPFQMDVDVQRTGKSKHVTIANALCEKSADEIAAGRKRIRQLYESRGEMVEDTWETAIDLEPETADPDAAVISDDEAASTEMAPVRADGSADIRDLIERARRLPQ